MLHRHQWSIYPDQRTHPGHRWVYWGSCSLDEQSSLTLLFGTCWEEILQCTLLRFHNLWPTFADLVHHITKMLLIPILFYAFLCSYSCYDFLLWFKVFTHFSTPLSFQVDAFNIIMAIICCLFEWIHCQLCWCSLAVEILWMGIAISNWISIQNLQAMVFHRMANVEVKLHSEHTVGVVSTC